MNPLRFLLSYAVGSFALITACQAQIIWDGSTSGNWNTSANWNLNRVPNGTELLTFPSAGANKTMNMNRPAGTVFRSFSFTGSGYTLNGSNGIRLLDTSATLPRIDVTHTSGVTTLNVPITLNEPTTFASTGFSGGFPFTSSTLLIGSAGSVALGSNLLTLNTATALIDIDGTISGTAGVETTGNSAVRFDGNQSFTGTTTVRDTSRLFVNGSLAGGLNVLTTASLRGKGSINGNATIGGIIEPGDIDTSLGRLTFNGNLTFGAASSDEIFFDLSNTTPSTGHDQLRAAASVTPNGARINLRPLTTFPIGSTFVLIDKTSAGVMNTSTGFLTPTGGGLSNGTTQAIGMNQFSFSYLGGNGNDFTATTVLSTSNGTREWDGESSSGLWSSALNWTNNTLPIASNTIIFGNLAASNKRSTQSNLGGNPFALSFTSGGYSVSPGAEMTLSAGIAANHSSGNNTISSNLTLGAPQSFALTGAGDLTVTNINTATHLLTAQNSSTGTLLINGAISGNGGLLKTGTGLLELGGSTSNTFVGTTNINAGELRLTKSSGNAIPGNVTIGDGINAASLTTTVTEKIANTAHVTVKPNASFLPGANESIGALTIDGGVVDAGPATLKLGGALTANTSTVLESGVLEFNGSIRHIVTPAGVELTIPGLLVSSSGSPLTVFKLGTGTLFLSDFGVGNFLATNGIVEVGGEDILGTLFSTQSPAVLRGTGQFNVLDASAGGTIEIGSAGSPGSEEITAHDFIGGTSAIFRPTIDEGGSDLLSVSSNLNLGGIQLEPEIAFTPALGDTFEIVNKQSTGVTTSRFMQAGSVLEEGDRLITPFAHFLISYQGGDGNDITLTTVAPSSSGTTRVWDGGGGADNAWSNPVNWVGDIAPVAGDSLEFPGAALNASVNNLPSGMTFSSLSFVGADGSGGKSINGNPIQLTGNITADGGSITLIRTISLNLDITLLNNATITTTSSGSGSYRLSFGQNLVTTTPTVEFVGGGGGSVNVVGLLSGPAQCLVNSAAVLNLDFSPHNFAGGIIVSNATVSGRVQGAAGRGITVNNGGIANLVAEETTIGAPVIVNSGGTLNITGTAQVSLGSLSINNGTVSCVNLSVLDGLSLNGSDSFTASTLTCGPTIVGSGSYGGDFTHTGGNFTISNRLDCANYTNVGNRTIPTLNLSGSLTLPLFATLNTNSLIVPNDATSTPHALNLSSGALINVDTLGDPALANQSFRLTGGGKIKVNTLLASDDFTINIGSLEQNGTVPASTSEGQIKLDIGILSGTGTIGALIPLAGGGSIQPGSIASSGVGALRIGGSGNVLNESIQLNFNIQGSAPGIAYDQLSIGDFTSTDPALVVTLDPSYTPLVNQEFVLINHTQDFNPFPGTIGNITEGATATLAPGIEVTYSYLGGDGNDFSATVTSSPAGEFRVWDGGGADNNWTTAQNWVGDVAPQADEALRFPSVAARLSNTNDFPSGTTFRTILIETGYTLAGNAINLDGDLVANIATGSSFVNLPITFLKGNDFACAIELNNNGSLVIGANLTIEDSTQLTLRRVDPTGTLIGTLDISGIVVAPSASSIGVFIEGGGKTRFLTGIRNYDRPTEITHGILEILGGVLPGDLTIGGGAFPAVFENPGGTNTGGGRIPDFSTLTLLPNGTHSLIGASAIEEVGNLIYAGGQRIQPSGAKFRVANSVRVEVDTTIDTPIFYDFQSGDPEDIIEVLPGITALLTSTISGDTFQGLILKKSGAGALLIQGTVACTELRAESGAVGPVNGGVINQNVRLIGGNLIGNSNLFGSLTGTATGGKIAPGGVTPTTNIGRLTFNGNLLPTAQTTLAFDIGGTTAATQHDQITVLGSGITIDLSSAQLEIALANAFTPTPGQTFTILDKSTGGAITRTFAGKPEGHTFTAAGFEWTISYLGGNGNDIVLTAGSEVEVTELGFAAATIIPGGPGTQATIGGIISGGAPNSQVLIQASTDLGINDNWTTIATITLDATGSATFAPVADPGSINAKRNFFRLQIP